MNIVGAPSIYWPLSLPQTPLRSGFSFIPGASMTSFTPSIGIAKTSKRSFNAPAQVSATYLLRNKTQKDDLIKFINDMTGISFFIPDFEGAKEYILVKINSSESKAIESITPVGGGKYTAQISFIVHVPKIIQKS